MKKLVYATTNQYKLSTAQAIFKKYSKTILTSLPNNVPDIPEIQADTQEAVAIDKARKCYEIIKQPLIVMDSGLFINGLNGFPGVYTKYALETIGVDGLIRLFEQLENRTAYTMRTIAYIDSSTVKTFSSRYDGIMQTHKRGTNGRDYDLVFFIPEKGKTIAELTDEEKMDLTSGAWKQLAEWIEKNEG